MGSLDFEGERIRIEDGDTVASALFRAGVRTFNRSLKYHRRRGLYCMSGDCPNCIVTVDGEPGVRSCTAEASEGQRVERETGAPSADRDVLAIADRAHRLMPVGFYYKTFIHPRWAWEVAERVIRRATGIGRLPVRRSPELKPSRHLAVDVLVIGGGVAGLSAATAAADRATSVLLVDEGRIGEKLPAGPTREAVHRLAEPLRAREAVTILERATAVGVYEGREVPVITEVELLQVDPGLVVVASGAVEAHAVFPGNDLPGVWLGRGATRLAGVHRVKPGARVVVATDTPEGIEHIRTLRDAGVRVAAAAVPSSLAGAATSHAVPDDVPVLRDGRIAAAEGSRQIEAVSIRTPRGTVRVACDALVHSMGYAPRDGLLRMSGEPGVVGAGEVILPGCSIDEAVESGARAVAGESSPTREAGIAPIESDGYVCLCEDVGVKELRQARREGFGSPELLKRYTTATMGPCQGALCGRLLASFAVGENDGHGVPAAGAAGARTTARPPARTVRLEDLAGAVHEVIEKRTSLHDIHREMGAKLHWSGSWMRPYHYGDAPGEYRAVRERVSLMDVGTLGKFLIAGTDAQRLVDRVFPCRVDDLAAGRARYLLALGEAGYVMDDGLLCALQDGSYYLTSTSGGADGMEAWLRNWSDRLELRAHVANQTAMLGAINVAGPRARDLLGRLTDDPIDAAALPYTSHREIRVSGVPVRAIRVGFVGELSFELHHPRSRGPELWSALLEAGRDLDARPHGLDALEVLRLEKGHVYLGQDTLPDDTPRKLGMGWAVAMDKPAFVGKGSLQRMAELPLERTLVGLEFAAGAPARGAPLYAGGRIVGRVTSSARSGALDRVIGLGWIRSLDGEFPSSLRTSEAGVSVVPTPFYDPEGERLRA